MSAGQSNGSKGSSGLRVLITVIVTLLPVGPGLVSGCGGDDAEVVAPPTKPTTTPADATVPLVMVVTAGGGGPSADGSGSGGGNPFGDLPEAGSSSGSGSSSGAMSTPDSGSSDGSLDGPEAAPPPAFCPAAYVPLPCGADAGDTCDLRSNTCCVTLSLQERCAPTCNSNEASVHCQNACDCPSGQSCCGVVNTLLQVVESVCQPVTDGLCNPHPPTNTQASAQLCSFDEECKNGGVCTLQTCEYGAMLKFCGLQSGDPFDCTAN